MHGLFSPLLPSFLFIFSKPFKTSNTIVAPLLASYVGGGGGGGGKGVIIFKLLKMITKIILK